MNFEESSPEECRDESPLKCLQSEHQIYRDAGRFNLSVRPLRDNDFFNGFDDLVPYSAYERR